VNLDRTHIDLNKYDLKAGAQHEFVGFGNDLNLAADLLDSEAGRCYAYLIPGSLSPNPNRLLRDFAAGFRGDPNSPSSFRRRGDRPVALTGTPG
jgi:hypothetical protein